MMRCSALILLSGCALHPLSVRTAVAPDLPAPKVVSDDLAQSDWWGVLPDESLAALVSDTLANNPDLRTFEAVLRQAEAMAKVSGSARYPSLSFASSFVGQPYTPFVLPIPGMNQDPDTEAQATIQTQFNLAYEADLFGKVRANAGAALRDAKAAALDLQAMQLMSTAQVVEMVLTVLEGREQLALLATNEKLLRQQRDFVISRYQAGLSNVLELRQQDELIATTVAQRPLLNEQIAAAGRRLSLLTGGHSGTQRLPKGAALPTLPAPWAEAVSATFVHRRPDVASAFEKLHSADHRLAAALASRLPSLRFNGAAGFLFLGRSAAETTVGGNTEPAKSLSESLGEAYDTVAENPADNLAWQLSVQLLQPIYQGGAVKGQIAAARAGREAAVERYRKAVLTAFDEVVSSHSGEQAQRSYLDRLKDQRRAVEASLNAAKDRYQAGLTEYRVLLQTQLALLRVDQALIRARRQVWSQRIRLLRAAAGSLGENRP
jgi:outer membrane protein TolC